MRVIFGIAALCIIIMIGICAIKSDKMSGRLARLICIFEVLAFACGNFFLLYTFAPGVTVTTLAKGLIMACEDWMIVLLVCYTQYYTGVSRNIRWFKYALGVFSAADTVAMVANTWTHGVFSVSEITDTAITVEFVKDGFFYQAHFVYSYGVVIMLLVSYVVAMAKVSSFYRFRYMVIFVTMFIAFSLGIATIKSTSIYDVSMLVYGVMCIMIYYLSLRYVPNELIENTFSLIIRDMNSGIICFDNRGRCIYCNDLVKDVFNIGDISIFEKNYAAWLAKSEDKRRNSMSFKMNVGEGQDKSSYEIGYKRIYDEHHSFLCDYFVLNDRTEAVQTLERERYKASHDKLTGLLNREQFYEDAARMLRGDQEHKYCIVCSNIKDFKLVNEIFGIDRGNEVIMEQADQIRATENEAYVGGRLQSDRFAVCMRSDLFEERVLLDSIRHLQDKFSNASFKLKVIAGVYNVDDVNEPISNMCDKAFLASDVLKNDYTANIAYYDEKMLKRTLEERRVIGEFDKALENGEFVMFLQPQVNRKGRPSGAEALVRWQHPQRGLISPFYFIDILESTGLIYKLDMYMWEEAAKKLSEWKEAGYSDYHISVNISTKDFYLVDVYEVFTDLVDKYKIDADLLKLEITETALMSDFDNNMRVIEKLKGAGFKIEIDDFGSGYSSLNMLKDINADVLKIDMAFLRASENEAKGQDILESIISLGSKLGMDVITEGVETEKQLDMLSRMGCNMFQGYYFSKPVPVSEFESRYGKGIDFTVIDNTMGNIG